MSKRWSDAGNLVTPNEREKQQKRLGIKSGQRKRGFLGASTKRGILDPSPKTNEPVTPAGLAGWSREERKLVRSFISQCAFACAANKLTETEPMAPRSLRERVVHAGGNITWLKGDRQYRVLFHEAYCRVLGKKVPYRQVWAERPTASALRPI